VADITWDDRALELYLAGVSTEVLHVLAPQVATVATALAPVRLRHTAVPRWAKKGYVGTPGHLRASVDTSYGRDGIGFYADVSALWYGRFMDPKARQLHYTRPFLPTALFSVIAGQRFDF
jgi:hypothetical protein